MSLLDLIKFIIGAWIIVIAGWVLTRLCRKTLASLFSRFIPQPNAVDAAKEVRCGCCGTTKSSPVVTVDLWVADIVSEASDYFSHKTSYQNIRPVKVSVCHQCQLQELARQFIFMAPIVAVITAVPVTLVGGLFNTPGSTYLPRVCALVGLIFGLMGAIIMTIWSWHCREPNAAEAAKRCVSSRHVTVLDEKLAMRLLEQRNVEIGNDPRGSLALVILLSCAGLYFIGLMYATGLVINGRW
jgi:hypothetical protein